MTLSFWLLELKKFHDIDLRFNESFYGEKAYLPESYLYNLFWENDFMSELHYRSFCKILKIFLTIERCRQGGGGKQLNPRFQNVVGYIPTAA